MKEINKKELSKRILLKRYHLIKSNQLINEIISLFFTREDLGTDIFHSQGKYLLDSLSKLSWINNELEKYSYDNMSKFDKEMFFENLKFCMRKLEEIIQLFTNLAVFDDSRVHQSIFHLMKKLHTYYCKISELNSSPQSMISSNYPVLYLSQKRISSPPFSLVLDEALCAVRNLIFSKNKPAPRIFISYAWPLPENNSNEFWIDDFLSTFANHLKLSGAIVYRDRSDSRWGYRIQEYMNKIKESDYFILIGSKSLKDKYEKFSYRMIQDEISEAITTKTHVIPILLSGSLSESFPRVILRNQSIEDWTQGEYFLHLKNVIQFVSSINSLSYDSIWSELIRNDSRFLSLKPTAKKLAHALGKNNCGFFHSSLIENKNLESPQLDILQNTI
ncbi:TPA: hypothetical protein JBJ46_15140 [Legionella pneumophila]|nr:hypothetical protein [Legionella pneumophila]